MMATSAGPGAKTRPRAFYLGVPVATAAIATPLLRHQFPDPRPGLLWYPVLLVPLTLLVAWGLTRVSGLTGRETPGQRLLVVIACFLAGFLTPWLATLGPELLGGNAWHGNVLSRDLAVPSLALAGAIWTAICLRLLRRPGARVRVLQATLGCVLIEVSWMFASMVLDQPILGNVRTEARYGTYLLLEALATQVIWPLVPLLCIHVGWGPTRGLGTAVKVLVGLAGGFAAFLFSVFVGSEVMLPAWKERAAQRVFPGAVAEVERRVQTRDVDWAAWENDPEFLVAVTRQDPSAEGRPIADELLRNIGNVRPVRALLACVERHENRWGAVVLASSLGRQAIFRMGDAEMTEAAGHLERYLADRRAGGKPFLTVTPTLMLAALYVRMLEYPLGTEEFWEAAAERLSRLGPPGVLSLADALRDDWDLALRSCSSPERGRLVQALRRAVAADGSRSVPLLLDDAASEQTEGGESCLVHAMAQVFGDPEVGLVLGHQRARVGPRLDAAVLALFLSMVGRPGGERPVLDRLEQEIRSAEAERRRSLSSVMARLAAGSDRVVPALERLVRDEQDPGVRADMNASLALARGLKPSR